MKPENIADKNPKSHKSDTLSEQDLEFWTRLYASEQSDEQASLEEFLIFRLGSERFAIAMNDIDEVISLSSGTMIPHVGDMILGIANNRGETLILLNTARALQATATFTLGRANRTLIVRDQQGRRCGLMVDAIEKVEALDPEDFNNPLACHHSSPLFRSAYAEYQQSSLFLVDSRPLRDMTYAFF